MEKGHLNILAVDDEDDVLEIIEYNLKQEGYRVHKARNGDEALTLARHLVPDLIILDVMMPVMDGIETCKKLRELPKLNGCMIVFLTARSEEFLEIAGFNAGADDYISKPIKPRALVSRVNAILRRKRPEGETKSTKIEAGGLIIDRDSYLVYSGELEYSLAKKEFELLYLLAGKPGKVFTRDVILARVWGNDVVVGNRTIDVHIRKVREKIGGHYISTVKGVGYKFNV